MIEVRDNFLTDEEFKTVTDILHHKKKKKKNGK